MQTQTGTANTVDTNTKAARKNIIGIHQVSVYTPIENLMESTNSQMHKAYSIYQYSLHAKEW